MSWFKIDDGSAFNAKVLAAKNEAWGAFCRVGAHCAQQLTDGRFSRAIAVTIAPMRVWTKLIEVGLVDPLEKGEMQIHDYLQRNPSKEQVLREREATKLRVNGLRTSRRTTDCTPVQPVAVTPLPSRPVPSQPPEREDARSESDEPRSGVHRSAPPVAMPANDHPETGYDLAYRLWHELWPAKYKRPYEQSGTRLTGPGSEDSVLVDVGGRALIRGDRAEAYLRHKIAAYLRDEGDRKWLVEHCHPLRTLTRDWAKYGDPKAPARMVPRRAEEPAEPVSAERQAEFAKQVAAVGRGGAG